MPPGGQDSRAVDKRLAVKGFDTQDTMLSCYSGAGFSRDLQAAHNPDIRLVGMDQLYAD
jgi:uncharacterized protein